MPRAPTDDETLPVSSPSICVHLRFLPSALLPLQPVPHDNRGARAEEVPLHESSDRLVIARAGGPEAAAAERLRGELVALQKVLRVRHVAHLVHEADVLLITRGGQAPHAVRLALGEILELGRRHLANPVQPAARSTAAPGTARATGSAAARATGSTAARAA